MLLTGCLLLLVMLVIGVAMLGYAYTTALWASRGRLFSDVNALPVAKVGLIFGTTDRVNGRENVYFRYRIDAAVKVWQAHKVETLIVSGDNISPYYNEPEKMKQALIERGIPADRIVCDKWGLRTLDSVVRAKEAVSTKYKVGPNSILFISQRFQNERAIYLAEANGMDAYGFNAQDVETQGGMKTKVREVGARVKMWLDVNFLNTRPIHVGDNIEMPE